MTAKNIVGITIATAAASLFLLAPTIATSADTASAVCYGANSCKGQSDCRTTTNACKGENACKGQGMTLKSSEAACNRDGGTNSE